MDSRQMKGIETMQSMPQQRGHNFMDLVASGSLNAAEKRRQDRNLREQQRSFKITKQIESLAELLDLGNDEAEVKKSKYSILLKATDRIKELKTENLSLLDTLKREQSSYQESKKIIPDPIFNRMFATAPIPMALAELDGRIMSCNNAFLEITGLQSDHVLNVSFFKLLQPHDCPSIWQKVEELYSAYIAKKQKLNVETPKTTDSDKVESSLSESSSGKQENNGFVCKSLVISVFDAQNLYFGVSMFEVNSAMSESLDCEYCKLCMTLLSEKEVSNL